MTREALLEHVVRELCAIERPSASEGERRAAELVAGLLEAEGCRVRIEQEEAHGGYWWPIGLLNGAAAVAALASARRPGCRARRLAAGVAGAVAAAGVADDVTGGRHWFRRVLPKSPTYNVVAETGEPDAPRIALVVAHHDAAHGGIVFDARPVYALQRRVPSLFEDADRHAPVMALVVLGPVLAAVGALLRRRGLVASGAVVSAGTTAAMVDIARAPISPAANDNASAVAALVGVARALRERPADGVRTILLSTGSEESFMEGMRGFARRHLGALPRDRTDVLCLECLGSPQPVAVEGEGMLWMNLYDRAACDELAAAGDEAGVPLARGLKTVLATDGLIAHRAGLRTATLATVDPLVKLPTNYHSPADVPDNLDWGSLGRCTRVVEAWVRRRAATA